MHVIWYRLKFYSGCGYSPTYAYAVCGDFSVYWRYLVLIGMASA